MDSLLPTSMIVTVCLMYVELYNVVYSVKDLFYMEQNIFKIKQYHSLSEFPYSWEINSVL